MLLEEINCLPRGKYTLHLFQQSWGPQARDTMKVTVLGCPVQHGYKKDGSWTLYGGPGWSPHYVLPVRKYRHKHPTAFAIAYIESIVTGW